MRNKISFFLFTFLFLAKVSSVSAVDLTVTCADEGSCSTSPSSGAALFTEDNQLPGDSVTRMITAVNNDADDDCTLTLDTKNETQTPTDFTDKLFTVIKDGATDIFGARDGSNKATSDKSLDSLFNEGSISLGTIPAGGGVKNYDWTVTFDPATGNAYQNAETQFDFDMHFECGGDEGAGDGGDGGGGGGGGGDGGCSDTAPSAPIGLSASAGVTSVNLTWTEPSESLTTYYILYGTSPGVYTFGSLSIGGPGTTNYLVTNLTGGTTYYFVVGAINGCAPGPYSNEASATPTGGTAGGLPPGFAPFAPGTLGVATEEAELATAEAKPDSEGIKGLETIFPEEKTCFDPWWWILVFAGQIVLHFLIYRNSGRENLRKSLFGQIITAVLAVVVFWLFFCERWYILAAVAIGVIVLILTYKKNGKENDKNELLVEE